MRRCFLLASLLLSSIGLAAPQERDKATSAPKAYGEQATTERRVWYGPITASFQVQFPGNPYDFEENDVRVLFTNERGEKVERLAYFDEGFWRATLVAEKPGVYTAALIRNGKPTVQGSDPDRIMLNRPMPRGYIRLFPHRNRFQFDSGEPYFPIGFNLAWQGATDIPHEVQIMRMGRVGVDWTRVWATHWDNKNPWWPQDQDPLEAQLSNSALTNWASWIGTLERNGLNFQMVLFHHGSFSTKTDPNWNEHPWNAKNGGFLTDAAAFFTNPQAKKLTKMWLRYAVARWAHSPNLMAWELFNEVEWTDAAQAGQWKEIADWHAEMAVYLRSIDPYKHLVTTSAAIDHPEIYEALDFYQPHLYGADVPNRVAQVQTPTAKPWFAGEFGHQKGLGEGERAFVRETIWRSLKSNQAAGAPMYWYWDRVESLALLDEFQGWAAVVQQGNYASHPDTRPVPATVNDAPADALGGLEWLMMHIDSKGGPAKFASTGLADGNYELLIVQLDTGRSTVSRISFAKFEAGVNNLPPGDLVVVIKKLGTE